MCPRVIVLMGLVRTRRLLAHAQTASGVRIRRRWCLHDAHGWEYCNTVTTKTRRNATPAKHVYVRMQTQTNRTEERILTYKLVRHTDDSVDTRYDTGHLSYSNKQERKSRLHSFSGKFAL